MALNSSLVDEKDEDIVWLTLLCKSDFDGDFAIFTKLFTDKFVQTDYIILNDNPTPKQEKVVLTEAEAQSTILKGLTPSRLGEIVNANTRIQCLMNSSALREEYVKLVNFKGILNYNC